MHEDDPERAVRCALRLLEGVEGLRRPDGGSMQARAGIMTGELLVTVGSDAAHGDGHVAGDAINTAQRLQASAPPGAAVAGDLTHQLTQRAITYEELPPWSAKGKTRPLVRWLARHPVARVGPAAAADRLSPLVGRDSELAFCGSLLHRVVGSGKPHMALLLGDPGIGKSRLVRELYSVVDLGSAFVTWRQGRCAPYGEERAFWALREIVQAHAGILETHDPAQAEGLLERAVDDGPDHRWICERLRPLVGLDAPEADPEENYAAWLRFFRQAAARRPLVAVIEDLHWADEAMLAFVDYVAVHLTEGPLLLVGTARPGIFERHPAFAASEGRFTRIWLDRLSDDETRTLVWSLPEMEGADPAAVALVASRAEGNPFFAEELARLLAGSAGDRASLAALPQSVQAVIAARIDALSPGAKAALADGAVIGAAFWRGALEELGGPAAADVGEGLTELADRQLVRAVRRPLVEDEEEYAFCHGMVREVAYAEIPRGVRARKHAAFARWLEDKVGERARGDLCDVLAWHYGAAAELARAAGVTTLEGPAADSAVAYLSVAGDRAMALDVRAAARHYERALDVAGPDHPARPRLLSQAAEALFQEGRYRESAASLLDAAVGLSAAGDRRSAALAAARRADVLYALGDPGVTLQLEAALSLLEGEPPCPETVTVLGKLGRSLWLAGDPGTGLERLEESLDLARRLELPEPALFLGYRGGIRCIMGDVGGLDDYERALRLAGERGRADEASLLTFNYADALLSYRGPAAAAAALAASLDVARRRRRRGHRPAARERRGLASMRSGSGTPRQTGDSRSTWSRRWGCSASGTRRCPRPPGWCRSSSAARRARTWSSSARRRRCCVRAAASRGSPLPSSTGSSGEASRARSRGSRPTRCSRPRPCGTSSGRRLPRSGRSTAGSAARGPAAARTTSPTCPSPSAPPSAPATMSSRLASRAGWRARSRCSATSTPRSRPCSPSGAASTVRRRTSTPTPPRAGTRS